MPSAHWPVNLAETGSFMFSECLKKLHRGHPAFSPGHCMFRHRHTHTNMHMYLPHTNKRKHNALHKITAVIVMHFK